MVRRLTWIAAAVALIGAIMAPPATAQSNREGRIRILGHGSVEAVPDFVMVRVGISNRAASPTAALDQNSATARKIVDFAKQFAISEQDIRTDSINLAQAFKSVREPNGSTQQVPDGYNASNFIRVRITDMSRLGTFMRQILDQGATNINGVSFGLSNPEKVADEARSQAMDDALHQAQQLAGSAKVKLGPIREIAHPPRTEFRAPVGEADLAVSPRGRITVPVEVGTITVSAEVDVTWVIE